MSDRKLTLFELHFNDAQFGPKWMGGSSEEEAEKAAEAESEGLDLDLEESRGRGLPVATALKAGLALGVLGGFAVAAKVLLGRGDDEQATLDSPEFEEAEFEEAEFEE